MRRIITIAFILLASTLSMPSRADQTDPRLDELFEELKAAPDIQAAAPIELAIWNIWVQHDDRVITTLMGQGIAAMSRRDYSSALRTFDQMVNLVPDFAEAWNKRATVHYLLGNYRESLADIERTLALAPRHFGALSGRGLVYIALEEEEKALHSFEQALAVHPNMEGARHNAEMLRKKVEGRPI